MKSKILVMPFVALMCMFYSCKKQSNDLSESELLTADGKNGVAQTSAVTYYVSAGPDGDNNRSSTQAQSASTPWKTIQKAVDNLPDNAGGTVIITGGTTYPYREKVNVPSNKGGTSTSRTIFKSKESWNPAIIDGGNTGTRWEALFRVQGNYITLENLKAQNGAWYGFQINTGSSNVVINNCKTFNTKASGVHASNSTWITISNNKIQKACQQETRDASGNGSQECITLGGCSNFYIRNNEIWDSMFYVGGEGIDTKGGCKNGEIHNNDIHDIRLVGIYVDAGSGTASNIRVYSNKINRCEYGGIAVGGELGGVAREIYFYNNVIKNGRRDGMYLRPEGTFINIYVTHNTFYNNGTHSTENVGDLINRSSNASNSNIQVKANIFYNKLTTADYSIKYNAGQPMVIDRNLFTDYKGTSPGTNPVYAADPKFLNVTGEDFHLTSTSPALNKAIYIYSPISPYPTLYTNDHDYKARAYTNDIGAFEY